MKPEIRALQGRMGGREFQGTVRSRGRRELDDVKGPKEAN